MAEPPRRPFSPGSAHCDLPSSRLTCPSPLARRCCSGPPGRPRSRSARNGSPAAPGAEAAAAAPHSLAPSPSLPCWRTGCFPERSWKARLCTWSARRPLSGPAPARNEACFALAGLIESGPLARLQAARRSRAAVDPEGRAGAVPAAQPPPGHLTYRGGRQCQGPACVCVGGGTSVAAGALTRGERIGGEEPGPRVLGGFLIWRSACPIPPAEAALPSLPRRWLTGEAAAAPSGPSERAAPDELPFLCPGPSLRNSLNSRRWRRPSAGRGGGAAGITAPPPGRPRLPALGCPGEKGGKARRSRGLSLKRGWGLNLNGGGLLLAFRWLPQKTPEFKAGSLSLQQRSPCRSQSATFGGRNYFRSLN